LQARRPTRATLFTFLRYTLVDIVRMQKNTEQELVERAKTDADAFGELYDLHYTKIFNYILRRTADVMVAEDITTNVFMKALDKISIFTWQGLPFSAWLYRIASHEISNHYRNKQSKNISLETMMEEQGFEPVSDIDIEAIYIAEQEKVARHRQFMTVQRELLKLPAKYQEALSLRYFEKKTIAEISTIMDKRPGTIKSLLSRGTKKLRETLAPK
jgi:RNA polymerase sigma-70 factor, ECF subfamily